MAYENVQTLRKAGKLRKAREQGLVCAQPACPSFVQTDCAQWITEIEASMPTVVVEGRDQKGEVVQQMRVFVDGELLVERLDGKAIPVDPGEHTFRFQLPGVVPKSTRVVILEGVKNQRVDAAFGTAKPRPVPDQTVGDSKPSDEAGSTSPSTGRGKSVLGWVLAGTGVAAIGVGGLGFWLPKPDCAEGKTCSEDEADSYRTQALVGDILVGVGAVSLGVGAALLLFTGGSAEEPAAQVSLSAGPTLGGGQAAIIGQF